jgi:hypothetical protein
MKSSEVNSSPLWNSTPSRSVRETVVPSSENSSARPARRVVFPGSNSMTWLYSCWMTLASSPEEVAWGSSVPESFPRA